MYSDELRRRARLYLLLRQLQETYPSNEMLNQERTEAHDALMMQLDIEGIAYEGRDGAAAVAEGIDKITEMGYNGDG